MATEVFDLLGRVSADVSPFNSAFDSSAKSVDQNLAAMYQSARNWLGAGGVAGVFGKAASEANQFGQIIADIASITDLQIKGVEKSLKRLDNVFGPPSRSGQTFYETISSGVRGSTDEVAKYVEAVGKTATTIRADIENTGNAMTTITNAYGKGINDTQSLLDFFYLTVREGKAHGDELARTLGLVVNNASEAGVSLNELGSAIAILSRTQSASQSMIGLNQLLNSMIKPTLQAQAEAKKWGIEMGASALQAKGLTATLQELHEKVGGNVEALEKMFGNIRAGRAILSLTGKQFDNFVDTLTAFEMGAGTGEAAFTKQIDTAYKDLIRLRAQTEKTLIQIGQDVEPVTRTFYNLSEAVMKGFNDTSAISRYTIYVGLVMKAVTMLSNELMKLSMTMSTIGNQMRGMSAGSNLVAFTQQRLSTATAANPTQVAKAATRMTPAATMALAQQNINAMYARNARGQLYNPVGGRYLNEQQLVADEYSRLRIILKQEQASLAETIRQRALARYQQRYGFAYDPNRSAAMTSVLGFFSGKGGALSQWVASIGRMTSRALSALGGSLFTIMALPAVWDIAYSSSKAIAEKFKFAESEVIKYFGQGWIGRVAEFFMEDRTAGGTNIDTDTAEAKNLSHNIEARKKATSSLISRAKVEGAISSAEARRLQQIVATTNSETVLNETLQKTQEARDRYIKAVNGTAEGEESLQRQIADAQAAYDKAKKDREQQKYTPSEAAVGLVTRKTTGIDITSVTQQEDARRVAELAKMRLSGGVTGEALSTIGEGTSQKALIEMRDRFTTDILKEYIAQSDEWKKIIGVTTIEELDKLPIAKDMSATQKDMYLLVLKNIKEAANAAMTPSELEASDEANRKAEEEERKRLRRLQSYEYTKDANARAEKITKQTEADILAADFERGVGLSKGRTITTESGMEYVRNLNVVGALDEALKKAVDSYNQKLAYLSLDKSFTASQLEAETENERILVATLGKKLAEAKDKVVKSAVDYTTAIVDNIKKKAEESFEATGLDPNKVTASLLKSKTDSAKIVQNRIAQELKIAEDEFAMHKDKPGAETHKQRIQELKKQLREATADFISAEIAAEEQRLAQLSMQKDAGILSESGYQSGVNAVYGGRVSRARTERDSASIAYAANKTTANFNRLQQATEALAQAQLEARIATKDFGDLQRKQQESLMGTVQDFASKKDSKGRLTNDALYHSLNLMARMMGPQASAALTNPSIEVMGQPSYKNAEKAQQAVAQSLDAYILSQKYAQATTGKTVQRIYDFISRNNSIVVRG